MTQGLLKWRLDDILLRIRPREEFKPVMTVRNRGDWEGLPLKTQRALIERAQNVDVSRVFLPMRYSEWQNRDADYLQTYHYRRAALRDLTLGEAVQNQRIFLPLIADIAWAILEESRWYLPGRSTVDAYALSTACDLLLAVEALDKPMLAAYRDVVARIILETQARALDPFLALENPPLSLDSDAARIAFGGLFISLMQETSDMRCWHGVKKAVTMLDTIIADIFARGDALGADLWLRSVTPAMCALELLEEATRMRFFQSDALAEIAHLPVAYHIANGRYLSQNCMPVSLEMPAVLLYRLGRRFGDESLTDLGAWEHSRQSGQEFCPIFFSLTELPLSARLAESQPDPPMPLQGLHNNAQIMYSRSESGWYLAARASADCALAGGFCALLDGVPLLASYAPPTIDGRSQYVDKYCVADDVNCTLEEDYAALSMSLVPAYPPECGLVSWQRTALLSREEGGFIRIWDAFDLLRPQSVAFSFIAYERPIISKEHIDIGRARMVWEGDLTAESKESGEFYLIIMREKKDVVMRGNHTFTLYLPTAFERLHI